MNKTPELGKDDFTFPKKGENCNGFVGNLSSQKNEAAIPYSSREPLHMRVEGRFHSVRGDDNGMECQEAVLCRTSQGKQDGFSVACLVQHQLTKTAWIVSRLPHSALTKEKCCQHRFSTTCLVQYQLKETTADTETFERTPLLHCAHGSRVAESRTSVCSEDQ